MWYEMWDRLLLLWSRALKRFPSCMETMLFLRKDGGILLQLTFRKISITCQEQSKLQHFVWLSKSFQHRSASIRIHTWYDMTCLSYSALQAPNTYLETVLGTTLSEDRVNRGTAVAHHGCCNGPEWCGSAISPQSPLSINFDRISGKRRTQRHSYGTWQSFLGRHGTLASQHLGVSHWDGHGWLFRTAPLEAAMFHDLHVWGLNGNGPGPDCDGAVDTVDTIDTVDTVDRTPPRGKMLKRLIDRSFLNCIISEQYNYSISIH